MDVGTDLSGQEVASDALLKNEANGQEIYRAKIGSNEISTRDDPAKEKMIFSEESSRAIFEMGNVELIELKKTSIQCPSCLHHVFEGTTICLKTQQKTAETLDPMWKTLMKLVEFGEPTSFLEHI